MRTIYIEHHMIVTEGVYREVGLDQGVIIGQEVWDEKIEPDRVVERLRFPIDKVFIFTYKGITIISMFLEYIIQ